MSDVVLITGAGTGLGLALARALRELDYRLILTARPASMDRFNAHGFEESARIRLRALDVTCDGQRRAVVSDAERDWDGIDVLINNAGVAFRSVVEDAGTDDLAEEMSVNFESPLRLIQLVLPGMRRKGRGRIVNISSVSGMLAMPTLGLYSASKYALEGISESLWYELRPFGIHVTLVQPGFIRSDSFRRTRFNQASERGLRDTAHPYHEEYRSMDAFIAKLMGWSYATPERVARKVARVLTMKRPPLRVAATPDAHLFAHLRRFLPRELFHRFLFSRLPNVGRWRGTGS